MTLRCLLVLMAATFGCREATPRPFDGAAALRYVETQMAFGPRIPGTEGHRRMGDWLDSLLATRADTVAVQEWTHVTARGDSLPLRNFVARFRPAETKRLLFLAHWDTRPLADAAGSERPAPVPGANDGGSGVAVLLGMADALAALPLRGGIGVDLLFVDGEDYGVFADSVDVLIGSRHYAARPVAASAPLYAVLFDMVGARGLQIRQEGYSLLGAPEIVRLVWDVARELGHGEIFLATPGESLLDDHVPLQRVGIRAINLIQWPYPHWHTPDDTIDKLSAASLQAVGEVGLALIAREE